MRRISRAHIAQLGIICLAGAAIVAFFLKTWVVGAALATADVAVGLGLVLRVFTQVRRDLAKLAKRQTAQAKRQREQAKATKAALARLRSDARAASAAARTASIKTNNLEAQIARLGPIIREVHGGTEEILDRLPKPEASLRTGRRFTSRRPRDLAFTDVFLDSAGQHLAATYEYRVPTEWGPETTRGQVRFDFDRPVEADETTVALALAAFIRDGVKSAFIDLDVTEAVADAIKKWAPVMDLKFRSVRGAGTPVAATGPDRPLLAFSGGMDSLAALQLLPDHTLLYGIDFGGGFAREREFFASWEPVTVTTNLARTPLRRTGWQFMAVPALMAVNHFRNDTLTFGSVDEKGNIFFVPGTTGEPKRVPLFTASGFHLVSCLIGLTEVGVTKIILEAVPELAAASMASSAGPHEDKGYWKRMLAIVGSSVWNLPFDAPDRPHRAQPSFAYGEYFPLDMLSFWVAKHGGREAVAELVRDVPDDVFTTADRLNLTFFERANPLMYGDHYPRHLKGALLSRFSDCGIEFYDDGDFSDIAEVREVLARYHPAVR
ncbi:MAG: hypothetical protein FWD59_07605 [Micrococcales bacterium]|nr:hypothetical protein [Micrococcales bacterium]